MTKNKVLFIFSTLIIVSMVARSETTYVLRSEADAWGQSVADMSFYKKVITTKNCKESLQKLVGCLQSIKYVLNRVLKYEPVEVVDIIPTAKPKISATSQYEDPQLNVFINNPELGKRYHVKKVIVQSGAVSFVEAQLTPDAVAAEEKMDVKNTTISDIVKRSRALFKTLYDDILKSPDVSFESIVDFIEIQPKDASFRYIIAGALNQYLENAIDPHTNLLLQKSLLKRIGVTTDDRDDFGFNYYLGSDRQHVKITEVFAKSSGGHSGLKRGDRILQINGLDITAENLSLTYSLLGKSDVDDVTLTVQTDATKPRTMQLQKIKYKVDNIESDVMTFGTRVYGYAKLRKFSTAADPVTKNPTDCDDLERQLKNFQKNAVGVVLDLRDNGGGSVDSALCIAGLFLGPEKVVLYQQNLKLKYFPDELMVLFSQPEGLQTNIIPGKTPKGVAVAFTKPLIVLVNQGSASASELLSSALRDHNRAIVVGTTTFGKGTMGATEMYLTKEADLKVDPKSTDQFQKIPIGRLTILATVARFFSPKGLSHHATGLRPHLFAYVGLTPTPVETLQMREEDRYLFPMPNATLRFKGSEEHEKMNKKTGDSVCIQAAGLARTFTVTSESTGMKDMQVLTGLQQMECELNQAANEAADQARPGPKAIHIFN